MIDAIGWIAAVGGVVATIPQLVRLLRTGSSAGVSLMLWQLTAAATAAWTVHGYKVASIQLQLPNLAVCVAALLVIIFVVRDRGGNLVKAIAPALALGAALATIDLTLGALIFGFSIAAPQLVGQVAQLRDLLTAPTVTGVSGGFLGAFLAVQALWFTFGVLTHDWALIVCAGLMVLFASANLGCYGWRRLAPRARQA